MRSHSLSRRVLVGSAVLTTTVVVLGAAAPAALADPPALDQRTLSCSALLAQVEDWPGTTGDGYRIFSDSHELSLLSQPECQVGA
jgi:hypothetical protein